MMRMGLHRRLKTVEGKVERLTKDVAETRIMAAKNDEDLAPFRQQMRAHVRVLNALRETQLEQGKTLDNHGMILARLTGTVDQHTAKLGEHTAKLDEHTEKLDQHTIKLDRHTAMLDKQGEKLDTLVTGQALILEHLGVSAGYGDEGNGVS